MTPYNNNNNNNDGQVTLLTNHSSPYDRLQVLASDYNITQTFPTTYVADEVFTGSWNEHVIPATLPPSRQPTDVFQSAIYLPPARQLPVTFDDVISARERAGYYDGSDITRVPDSSRRLCQYASIPVSGSSASSVGTHQMTRNSSSSLTVYPMSSSPWFDGQQVPRYRTCAEYRMSRQHVISDFTPGQCGWTGVSDFDNVLWREKFVKPL